MVAVVRLKLDGQEKVRMKDRGSTSEFLQIVKRWWGNGRKGE
jgi:hypothetical protein